MKRNELKSYIREEIIATLSEDKNDDKIAKYEQYTYTLDGKVVKPEIAFYNNLLKAELDGTLYKIEEPVNGKIELRPISGKTGMYTEAIGVKITGNSGKETVTSFKDLSDANRFKQENPNIRKITPLEEETGTPSDGMHQVMVSYIKPQFKDSYPKDYNKYFTFLKAKSKPFSGPNKPQVWVKFLTDLVKNKVVSLNDLLEFAKKYNDGRDGIEGLAGRLYKQGTPEMLKAIDNLSQSSLDEMARAKVSYALNTDKAQDLKDVIEKAKGNVKKALEYLLDKETMSVADVAKELGLKDTASINNPKFRELMNALKEKGIVSLVGASAEEKPVKAKPAKVATKTSVEKDIETGEEEADDYYKADDEDSAPEETDIDKQAAKAATKLAKRTSKLDKVLKGLIQVEKEMKELAGEYKNAEGEEKANIVAKLKEKTAQKKELEALKDKYEFDVV